MNYNITYRLKYAKLWISQYRMKKNSVWFKSWYEVFVFITLQGSGETERLNKSFDKTKLVKDLNNTRHRISEISWKVQNVDPNEVFSLRMHTKVHNR